MSEADIDARRRQREQRRVERLRLLASGPPSHCISVCQMDPATGWCMGCKRTIDEIREWMLPVVAGALIVDRHVDFGTVDLRVQIMGPEPAPPPGACPGTAARKSGLCGC